MKLAIYFVLILGFVFGAGVITGTVFRDSPLKEDAKPTTPNPTSVAGADNGTGSPLAISTQVAEQRATLTKLESQVSGLAKDQPPSIADSELQSMQDSIKGMQSKLSTLEQLILTDPNQAIDTHILEEQVLHLQAEIQRLYLFLFGLVIIMALIAICFLVWSLFMRAPGMRNSKQTTVEDRQS